MTPFILTNTTLDDLPKWLMDQKHPKDAQPTPLNIYINCSGGNILSAFAAINLMETYPKPITTTIIGCAESAAMLIAIAGHKRTAFAHSFGMLHPFVTNIEGTFHDHMDAIKHNKMIHKIMKKIIKNHSGLNDQQIQVLLGPKNTWLTPFELLEMKLIDSIIEVEYAQKDDPN